MSKWLELAERCEKATGPDREIECLIAVEAGDVPAGYTRHDAFTWICPQPPFMNLTYSPAYFTASLDAITALIERELPGWYRASGFNTEADADDILADGHFAVLALPSEESRDPIRIAACASEALARCAAFCRAMAAKDTT